MAITPWQGKANYGHNWAKKRWQSMQLMENALKKAFFLRVIVAATVGECFQLFPLFFCETFGNETMYLHELIPAIAGSQMRHTLSL
jgi:hypothetical protein